MPFSISKEFAFEAAHWLDGLPDGHQCGRMHGHGYRVQVTLTGPALDPVGMLVDYGDLKPFGRWLTETFDHKTLNTVVEQPTAENLARYLHTHLLGHLAVPPGVLVSVGVSETAKTWAWYTPDAPEGPQQEAPEFAAVLAHEFVTPQ